MTRGSVPLNWRLQKPKYALVGTQCASCGSKFLPPRSFCPACRRRVKVEQFQCSGKGSIETFTIIRVAPEGFEEQAPYAVAIIRMDEGPRISGQVIGDFSQLDFGKRVETVVRKMTEDGPEGLISYAAKWRVVA